MNARHMLKLTAVALVVGAPVVGGTALLGGLAIASDNTDTPDARKAAQSAKAARKALARREGQQAVTHAEAAVALDPRNGEYRRLLGESYLFAGRFVSAQQALGEALSLDPANGRTALNLALAQIANGEWQVARQTLATHEATIPASDRGLAFALAGDPATAVQVLTEAAREPGADAKTRQNLALAFALAGEWQQAKIVAAADLPANQVDGRIMQWASFSRPANAYDQVAALLGVVPIADEGQPQRLALANSMTVSVAAQTVADPVDADMPGATAVDSAQAVAAAPAADVGSAPTVEIAAPGVTASSGSPIVFAERREIVQAIPSAPVRALAAKPAAAVRASAGTARMLKVESTGFVQGNGEWAVQLGAYDSHGVARDAWGRAVTRVPALHGMTPSSASITTDAGAFQRLSVAGFTRAEAMKLCGRVRAKGGNCFVRTAAGDKAANWGVRVASR